MAELDSQKKKLWMKALSSTTVPWVVCGFKDSLDGMPGLIDWLVHGQVSRLVKQGKLAAQEACVLPGDPARQRPSFLLFPVSAGAPALFEKLRKLAVSDLALAESSFPEDFLAKVKQNLKKEGIRCTTLEPEINEPR